MLSELLDALRGPCPTEWCEFRSEPQRMVLIIGVGYEASKAGGVEASPSGLASGQDVLHRSLHRYRRSMITHSLWA